MTRVVSLVPGATGALFDGSAYFNRPGPRLVDSLEPLEPLAAAVRGGAR